MLRAKRFARSAARKSHHSQRRAATAIKRRKRRKRMRKRSHTSSGRPGRTASPGIRAMQSPLAPPGTYQVRLTVGDQVYSQHLEIRKNPHIRTTQAQLQEQFALLLAIRDNISELHTAINTIRAIRRQIDEWQQRAKGLPVYEALEKQGKKIKQQLTPIEDELFQSKARDQLDTLDYPMKLSAQLASLAEVVASAAPPTRQAEQVFDELSSRLATQVSKLHEVIGTSVAEFNALIREADLPAIVTSLPQQEGAKI